MTTTVTRQFDHQIRNLQRISQKPSLQALAYALRNPDVWPKNFTWNYGRTDCCAMALAGRLWPQRFTASPGLIEMQSVFGLSAMIAYKLFFGGGHQIWFSPILSGQMVAPAQVADAIDVYLKNGDPLMMMFISRRENNAG